MKLCNGVTLKGERCKRPTDGASEFCYSHQGQRLRDWCRAHDAGVKCKNQAHGEGHLCEAHLGKEKTHADDTEGTSAVAFSTPGTPQQPSRINDLHFVGIRRDDSPATNVREAVADRMKDDLHGKQGYYSAPTGTEGTWNVVGSGTGATASYRGPATFGRLMQEMMAERFVEKKKTVKLKSGFSTTHEWKGAKIPFAYIKELCARVKDALLGGEATASALLKLKGPAYILGDFHGNYHDLNFFLSRCSPFGADIMPFQYVFLGDYVDRGPHSLEVVLRLFALKLAAPRNVWLLRGNHEDPSINSSRSFAPDFRSACLSFNSTFGHDIWCMVNDVFDHLPLAAVIEEGQKKIFCCHGGIPRISKPGILDEIAAIRLPLVVPIEDVDKNGELILESRSNPLCMSSLVLDLLWADPMREDSRKLMGQEGFPAKFGPNERSKNAVSQEKNGVFNCSTFSNEAARDFFGFTGCSYLIRAHEHRKLGFSIQGEGTVITVFSTSSYQDSDSLASIILFNDGRLNFIILNSETGEESERFQGHN